MICFHKWSECVLSDTYYLMDGTLMGVYQKRCKKCGKWKRFSKPIDFDGRSVIR